MRRKKNAASHGGDCPQGATTVRTRPGARVTTREAISRVAMELFVQQGYENTTVDEIAEASGISRRTFFRYFSSKPEVFWGDFDELLADFRRAFRESSEEVPAMEAVLAAMLDFGSFPEHEEPYHRGRMTLLLNVPSLRAYTMMKYADWRQEIAHFVAGRRGEDPGDLAPQTISWVCLGLSLSAYERWILEEDSDLVELLHDAFASAKSVFGTRDTATFG